MSLNNPSRLYISSADSEWTQNQTYAGQSLNFTLPEQVLSATGVDLARAVIPTSLYNIPDYQNTFYFSYDGYVQSLVLTNNKEFDEISDLITQLNADATAQNKSITFAYNTTTRRIQVVTSNTTQVVIDTNNYKIPLRYTPDGGGSPTIITTANIPLGVYTKTSFLTALSAAITNIFATVPASAVAVSATATTGNVISLTPQGGYTGVWQINELGASLTAAQILGFKNLLGFSTLVVAQGSIVFPGGWTALQASQGIVVPAFAVPPRSSWLSTFALNTRLGFPDSGLSAVQNTIVGTFLPNILRTRVIYVCSNLAANDTLSPTKKSDAIRSCIAKVPVNSTYGGMTIYQNNDFNWCRIVSSTIQNIEIYLLDENLQPYNLAGEEQSEYEFVFRYSGDKND